MIRQFAIDINIDSSDRWDCDEPTIKQDTEYKIFEKTAAAFNIAGAVCPKCISRGAMGYHAEYSRWLITWANGIRQETAVNIERVICGECNATHAILPDIIIPYMQYSLLFVLGVIREYRNRTETGKTVAAICAEYGISISTLYEWKARFEIHAELDLGLTDCADNATARYWSKEGAVISGVTKEFFMKHGFSFMQSRGIATRLTGTAEIVASDEAVPHSFEIVKNASMPYSITASKNSEMEVEHGKSKRTISDGAVQVRADCAFGTEDISGCDSLGILQTSSGVAAHASRWDRTQVQSENDTTLVRVLCGGWAGCANQATTQGQRADEGAFPRRDCEDIRNQRSVPETACDASKTEAIGGGVDIIKSVSTLHSAIPQGLGFQTRSPP